MIADRLENIRAQIQELMLEEARARSYDARFREMFDKMVRIYAGLGAETRAIAHIEAHVIPASARAGLSVVEAADHG